jgi:predicted deacylase
VKVLTAPCKGLFVAIPLVACAEGEVVAAGGAVGAVRQEGPTTHTDTFVLSEADGFVMTVVPSGVQVNEGDAVATIR